jgi:hypothetical protein
VSENDERDPQETHSGSDPDAPIEPMGAFEAFRARREAERAANEPFEPFPAEYLGESTPVPPAAYEAPGRYDDPIGYPAAAYSAAADFGGPGPEPGPAPGDRRRLRSVAVLALVVLIAGGIGAGIYAAVSSGSSNSSGGNSQAATGTPANVGTPAPASTAGVKTGRTVTARVTVVAISGDSFTAQTAAGQSVTVVIGARTRFGTAGRPFSRAQLVPGAKLIVRGVRSGTDGIAATILAGSTVVATPTAALPAA